MMTETDQRPHYCQFPTKVGYGPCGQAPTEQIGRFWLCAAHAANWHQQHPASIADVLQRACEKRAAAQVTYEAEQAQKRAEQRAQRREDLHAALMYFKLLIDDAAIVQPNADPGADDWDPPPWIELDGRRWSYGLAHGRRPVPVLLSACPACGTETRSEPIESLIALAEIVECFQPAHYHRCPRPPVEESPPPPAPTCTPAERALLDAWRALAAECAPSGEY
jgi:hypothetical protein